MWILCPLVNGSPAWMHAGKGKGKVRMERIDTSKPFEKGNMQLVHGKDVLIQG